MLSHLPGLAELICIDVLYMLYKRVVYNIADVS